MEKYILFLLLALLSEIIGTVSGFGSSILFVPIASIFFDFKAVLGITAIFHVFSNLSKIALFRKGIHKAIAIKLGIPAVLFVIVGAWLTRFVPTQEMELGMNIVIACLAIYLFIKFNKPLEQSNSNLYTGGAISGFFAGLVGTGGAVRGITLAAFHLPKDVFIATSALIDLGVDASRAVVYVSSGYFPRQFLVLLPFLLAIGILGSYLGKLILRYTSEKVFRYLVLGIIILTSVLQFINYFHKI